MDIFGIITLLGGLALFLYGMKVLGDGLEKRAGNKLKGILENLTSNPVKGVLLGAAVTAIIQSSSATTVMVVGFVNSGIMKLGQSVGVILGANLGTTITSWILSLTGIQGESIFIQLLKPSSFSPVLALIGIIMLMFSKRNKNKDIGTILLGFAVLMFGMETMSSAVAPLSNSPEFAQVLTLFESPLLGVVTGMLVTAVIQSSSASVGILQALAVTGSMSFATAIPIIWGQNIGTCITALLSSIGTNKDARRTALVHLYYNIIGKGFVFAAFYAVNAFMHFDFMEQMVTPVSVALIHTLLNLISVVIMLPFTKQLEKLATLSIKGSDSKDALVMLDERLMTTPSIAIDQAKQLTFEMVAVCKNMLDVAIDLLKNYDAKKAQSINDMEGKIDVYEDRIGTYLVELSAKSLTNTDNRETQRLLHAIGDFERIADHAVNIMESSEEMHEKGINFSPIALHQLNTIIAAVQEIVDISFEAFEKGDTLLASRVEPLEDTIDDLRTELKSYHIERLQNGDCTIELGFIFSDVIANFERVSDHCSNIAAYVVQIPYHSLATHEYMHGIKDPDNEAFAAMLKQYKDKYQIPTSLPDEP